jgi:hypothetical protein
MALGELIEESRGKTTGQRVLDVQVPKMEASLLWRETSEEHHAQMLGLIHLC